MNEVKTITAELSGVKQQKSPKPTQYEFINPEGSTYALTIGAFPPNLPQLEIGKVYTFPCEFKPTKDDPHKFHKNFVRTLKDGPYIIKEAAKDAKQSIQAKPRPMGDDICQPEPVLGTPTGSPLAAKIYAQAKQDPSYNKPSPPISGPLGMSVGERAEMDRKKAAEAPMREWGQRRGGLSHDAAKLVAAVAGRIKGDISAEGAEANAIALADIQLKITDKLMKAAEEKEKEFKKSLNPKPFDPTDPSPTNSPAKINTSEHIREEGVLAGEGGEPNTTKNKVGA